MRSVAYIACSSCGAGLPFAGGEVVSCAYCDSKQQPPEHLELVDLGVESEVLHAEGARILASAWARKWVPGALSSEIWAMVVVLVTCIGTVTIGVLAGLSFASGVGVFFGLALLTMVPMGALLGRLQEGARRRAFDAARSEIRDRQRKAECPHCGGKLVVPPFSTATTCLFCSHPLAVAEGILIERNEDAKTRRDAWKSAAEAYVAELAETEAARAKHVPAVTIISLVLLIVGVVAVPAFVVWSQHRPDDDEASGGPPAYIALTEDDEVAVGDRVFIAPYATPAQVVEIREDDVCVQPDEGERQCTWKTQLWRPETDD